MAEAMVEKCAAACRTTQERGSRARRRSHVANLGGPRR
jgi:hypothetical protein